MKNLITELKYVHSRICNGDVAKKGKPVVELLKIWKVFSTEKFLDEIKDFKKCAQIDALMKEIKISDELEFTLTEYTEIQKVLLRGDISRLPTAYDYFLLYTILYVIQMAREKRIRAYVKNMRYHPEKYALSI